MSSRNRDRIGGRLQECRAALFRAAGTPEIRLLAALTRARAEDFAPEALEEAGTVDWERLLWLSRRHAVFPMVFGHLHRHLSQGLPPGVHERLESEAAGEAARAHRLVPALLELLDAMAGAGIDAMPYKGPVLAAGLFGDVALRSCEDLDLLVAPRDAGRADRVMESLGYARAQALTPIQQRAELRFTYYAGYRHRESGLCVEIHWRPVERRTLSGSAAGLLLHRRRTVELWGRVIQVPNPSAQLLLLCLHGGRHFWETLRMVADVGEWLRVHRNVDPREVLELARRTGCRRLLVIGLVLARDLLEAPLPPEFQHACDLDAAGVRLADVYLHRILADAPWHSPVEQQLLSIASRERLRDRVRPIVALSWPTERDWRRPLPLPAACWPAYFVVRPLRLVASRLGRRAP